MVVAASDQHQSCTLHLRVMRKDQKVELFTWSIGHKPIEIKGTHIVNWPMCHK